MYLIALNLIQDILSLFPAIEFSRIVITIYCPNSSLVSCTYCNFTEDHSVTRGKLIHQWIGCKFIEKRECKTLEQVAYEYLDELVQMSMVHVTRRDSEGRIRSCQVSNLARGFILSTSEKVNFINVLRSPSASLGGEKTRRLSLHNCFPSVLKGQTSFMFVPFLCFGETIFQNQWPMNFSKTSS